MAWNNVWEKIFSTQEWGKYPSEELIRFIAKNFYKVEDRKSIKILEIGSGQGANIWYIAREGFKAYGIEGSYSGVKKTLSRLENEVPNWQGEVIVGDMLELPYPNETFDAVIDIEALSNNELKDVQKVLLEVHRVLKSGGKFFCKHFANGSWGEGKGEFLGHNSWVSNEGPMSGKGICRYIDKQDIEGMFREFKILEVDKVSRTYANQQQSIMEWVITVQKQED